MPAAQSFIVIMSDDRTTKVAGYAGHPLIRTPTMDRLAAAGTRFNAANTPSPISMPALSPISGRPLHHTRLWNNAVAYNCVPPSRLRMLLDSSYNVSCIGNLHYLGQTKGICGFTTCIPPMHIASGVGDITNLVRDSDDVRLAGKNLVEAPKPGESDYTINDSQIAEGSCLPAGRPAA